MPDGFRFNEPETIEARVVVHMIRSDFATGALAWLRFQFPSKCGPHDSEALALHFLLFAQSSLYWARLCGLFRAVGLSDGAGWNR